MQALLEIHKLRIQIRCADVAADALQFVDGRPDGGHIVPQPGLPDLVVGFGKLAPEIEQEADVQGKVAHDPIKPLPYGKTGEVLKFFPYGVPRLDAGPGFR